MNKKSIIFSDVHIGNISDSWIEENGKEFKVNETFKQLDFIIDYAIRNKIKKIFHLGDIYNSKRPAPMYEKMLIERLNKLEKNEIATRLILGNHTSSNSSESALAPISKIDYEYIKAIEKIDTEDNNLATTGIVYLYIPHIVQRIVNEYNKLGEVAVDIDGYLKAKIKQCLTRYKNNKVIIMGHMQWKGVVVGSEETLLEGGINIFPEVDKKNILRIFLGHIHKYQMLKWGKIEIVYPGSIVRCNFSERNEDKGFIVYDEDTDDWDFIELDTVKYKQIKINLVDKDVVDLNEEKIKKVAKDKIIKLVIEVAEHNRKRLNFEEIETAFNVWGHVTKRKIDIIRSKKKIQPPSRGEPCDILQNYVNANTEDIKQKETVLQLGQEILEEVLEERNENKKN